MSESVVRSTAPAAASIDAGMVISHSSETLVGSGDARTPYADELVRTGARRADWWQAGDSAIVLVVYGAPIPAPVRRTAVHVVPIGWVSPRRPTARKKMPRLDLAWSWADVVAVSRRGGAEPATSLAEQKETQK